MQSAQHLIQAEKVLADSVEPRSAEYRRLSCSSHLPHRMSRLRGLCTQSRQVQDPQPLRRWSRYRPLLRHLRPKRSGQKRSHLSDLEPIGHKISIGICNVRTVSVGRSLITVWPSSGACHRCRRGSLSLLTKKPPWTKPPSIRSSRAAARQQYVLFSSSQDRMTNQPIAWTGQHLLDTFNQVPDSLPTQSVGHELTVRVVHWPTNECTES